MGTKNQEREALAATKGFLCAGALPYPFSLYPTHSCPLLPTSFSTALLRARNDRSCRAPAAPDTTLPLLLELHEPCQGERQ